MRAISARRRTEPEGFPLLVLDNRYSTSTRRLAAKEAKPRLQVSVAAWSSSPSPPLSPSLPHPHRNGKAKASHQSKALERAHPPPAAPQQPPPRRKRNPTAIPPFLSPSPTPPPPPPPRIRPPPLPSQNPSQPRPNPVPLQSRSIEPPASPRPGRGALLRSRFDLVPPQDRIYRGKNIVARD